MIRTAQPKDIERCLELLVNFANASLYDCSDWTTQDLVNARNVLFNLMTNEYLKVAVVDDTVVGMIGAQREQDPWLRNRQRVRELFWWVEPDYRSSRISVQLFAQWQKDCDMWIKNGLAQQVSLSTQPGRSQIDLNKRGWQCIEQHWIKE
jgi:hypothetical protein